MLEPGRVLSFKVGEHRVAPGANEISGVRVDGKSMAVLLVLVEVAPDVVAYSALLRRAWPGAVVVDNVLHQAISQLRKVLGDSARVPRYIENIPRRGYRLIAAVESEAQVQTIAAVPPGISTVAVLPFVNLSRDPDQEFFSDGIAEDILNGLSKNRALTVRPRSSSFAMKGERVDMETIRRRLGVTHVVEGSVRRSGGRIRVTAQLNDVLENRTVWSERYDGEITDLFEVQDEIAQRILCALRVQLDEHPSVRHFASVDAYSAFLRGRHQLRLYNFGEAMKWLEKATALDPRNADAWACRALIHAYRCASCEFANGDQQGRHLIEMALAIDSTHAIARGVRALMHRAFLERDYEGALIELVGLIEIQPNNEDLLMSLGCVLCTIGRGDLLLRVGSHAVKVAPLSRIALLVWMEVYGMFGSLEEYRSALEEFESFGYYSAYDSVQLALADRDPAALRTAFTRPTLIPNLQGFPALIPYLEGAFEAARELVEPLDRHEGYLSFINKWYIALIERDLDAAFRYFRDAVRAGEPLMLQTYSRGLGWRQTFPEFYADPRFLEALEEFGLDPVAASRIPVPDLPF